MILARRVPTSRMLWRSSPSSACEMIFAHANRRRDRRLLRGRCRDSTGQRRHRDQSIAVKAIGEHLAIARLENVQRLHRMRKDHKLGQRKQADATVEIIGQSGNVFQIMHRC